MNPVHSLCVALVALVVAVLVGAPATQAAGNTLSTAGSQFFSLFSKTTNTNPGVFDTQKIIGGYQTSIRAFPFMAAISVVSGKTMSQQCGATILDMTHILTAAHCFKDRHPKIYRVRVGSDYWRYKGQLKTIRKIMVHPLYNATSFDFDVAVAELSKPIIFSSSVKPVALVPVSTAVKVDTPVTLIGWGYTDPMHSQPTSNVLRAVKVLSIASSECADDYSEYDLTVTRRMFCAMTEDKDSCQGDSGGPAMIKGRSGSLQQQGIISWSMGCAQFGSPGVFADVSHPVIRKFIKKSCGT